jgi:hypothetical protein
MLKIGAYAWLVVFVALCSHTCLKRLSPVFCCCFGGDFGLVDVEFEVHSGDGEKEKVANVSVDVNDLVDRVRDFVESIRETSLGGNKVAVNVEGFNFSVGKNGGKYDLKVNVSLSFTPKEAKPLSFEPF